MTSISCGGGPSIAQRRKFAGIKDGGQVPGYRGYCPQYKYSVGKTYGEQTHLLSKSYDHVSREPLTSSFVPQTKPPLRNELPDSNGDNKYTKTMVPGYTGYIPRSPFKFGGTYKEDCDVCIDEHMTNYQTHAVKDRDLYLTSRSQPHLRGKVFDPELRDHLNTYRDTHPRGPIMLDNKRGPTEPPIPGYRGYVPRIYTTETGLGCRYHDMAQNGLDTFAAEQQHQRKTQSAPISIDRMPGAVDKMAATYSKRLYQHDGMIPKYTGYMPQGRYQIGNTYGGMTRGLDCCSHRESCFGDYMNTRNTMKTALV